jgi:anthranilate phosphoribosyltransferase
MVVNSDDGLDEISLATGTHIAELKDGQITEYELQPEDVGLQREPLDDLVVDSVDSSLDLMKAALSGETDARSRRAAHLVALNAGAALYVAGVTDNIASGVALANEKLASGAAMNKLQQLVYMTQEFEED